MFPLWMLVVLSVVLYSIGLIGFSVYLLRKQKKFFFQKKDDEPKNRPPTPPGSDITRWE